MKMTSRAAKLAALATALVAHGALALSLVTPEKALMEGANGAAEVRLGNAFADMVAGVAMPEPAEVETPRPEVDTAKAQQPPEAAQPAEPETYAEAAEPVQPTPEAEARQPAERAQAVEAAQKAKAAQAAEVEQPAQAQNAPAPTATEVPEDVTVAPGRAVAALQPVKSAKPAKTVATTATAAAPAALARPAPPLIPDTPVSEVAPPTEPPTDPLIEPRAVPLTGTDPEVATVTRSKRPKMRSAEFAEAHKPATPPAPVARTSPKKKPTKTAAKPKTPKGNAAQNARAGVANGTATAKAQQSGSGGRKKSAGNAAVSNYPGLVMRKLSRVGKPRVNARGATVVAFTISGSGGLASVSVARSSGSSALDSAAMQLVRRAAPFPKPPSGARRGFSIQIKGR